jgi:hypothetical protein
MPQRQYFVISVEDLDNLPGTDTYSIARPGFGGALEEDPPILVLNMLGPLFQDIQTPEKDI